MIHKELVVNGRMCKVVVDSEETLANVLRVNLGLTGVKVGCGEGQCGACSIIMDGKVVRSCALKMRRIKDGANIMTVEGIGTPDDLHPIQMAWMAHGGPSAVFVPLVLLSL